MNPTRIFQAGKPVQRLSHDKRGNVRMIQTVEAAAGSQSIRHRKTIKDTGYKLSPRERTARRIQARAAFLSRSRNHCHAPWSAYFYWR